MLNIFSFVYKENSLCECFFKNAIRNAFYRFVDIFNQGCFRVNTIYVIPPTAATFLGHFGSFCQLRQPHFARKSTRFIDGNLHLPVFLFFRRITKAFPTVQIGRLKSNFLQKPVMYSQKIKLWIFYKFFAYQHFYVRYCLWQVQKNKQI